MGKERGPPGSLEKANWCFISNKRVTRPKKASKLAQLTPLNQTKRQFLYIKSANALLVCSISTVTTVPIVFFFFFLLPFGLRFVLFFSF